MVAAALLATMCCAVAPTARRPRSARDRSTPFCSREARHWPVRARTSTRRVGATASTRPFWSPSAAPSRVSASYLFSAGPQTAAYNAFNWFFAPTRAGSAFAGWDQAIATVAAGLRGPLYYGAGRYAVGAIAPVYCPQGTQAWIDNVRAYMLELGADPGDTRWPGARTAGATRPPPGDLRIFAAKGAASSLVVARPILLVPATAIAGARLRIRFTLTNTGLEAGSWRAVILRLQGPSGQDLALGSRVPLRLAAGASYGFQATIRPRVAGTWRGWVDVEAASGAILAGARPVLHLVVAPAPAARSRAAGRKAYDLRGRPAS